MNITPAERRVLAEKIGVDEQYLYQCLTGRKAMKAEEAVRAERLSGMVLRRWHLRPKDWYAIWPELIGVPGAPKAPADAYRGGEPTDAAACKQTGQGDSSSESSGAAPEEHAHSVTGCAHG